LTIPLIPLVQCAAPAARSFARETQQKYRHAASFFESANAAIPAYLEVGGAFVWRHN
jgi:hypothetical protein